MKENVNFLLVEDSDLDVTIFKRALKAIEAPNTLVRARDGVEALQFLKEKMVDPTLNIPYIILLDINMPRMNGHEFLTALRATEGLKGTRVFMFTTSDNEKDVGIAYQNNATGYIVKPNTCPELKEILKTLISFLRICENPPSAFRA